MGRVPLSGRGSTMIAAVRRAVVQRERATERRQIVRKDFCVDGSRRGMPFASRRRVRDVHP